MERWSPVATALISDLHLAKASEGDVLRRRPALDALVAHLERVDHLVLLGDLVELREAPLADVLRLARPVIAAIGRALAGRRVTLVPGNHDYQLAAPLVERLSTGGNGRLELETFAPPPPSGALGAVAE